MVEIMKLNGVVEQVDETETFFYDWRENDITYYLLYDKNRDLYAVTLTEFDEELLSNVVNELYEHDFPATETEYIDILFDFGY
ncbi:MAG: hypothetical protein Q4B84_03635 [Clostridia bacterium]|nr:hypothetical protein [Clostridia bacterium]